MNPDLLSGTSLGPYQILAPLGHGAMGEVYRARDTRLNRTVAIKFLAADLGDALARRRFQQEAQTASSGPASALIRSPAAQTQSLGELSTSQCHHRLWTMWRP